MFAAGLSIVIALFLGLQGPVCMLRCLSDAGAGRDASVSSVSDPGAPSMTPCHGSAPAPEEPMAPQRGGCASSVLDPCAGLEQAVAGDSSAPGLLWDGLVLHEPPSVLAAASGAGSLVLRRGGGLAPDPSAFLHSTVLRI